LDVDIFVCVNKLSLSCAVADTSFDPSGTSQLVTQPLKIGAYSIPAVVFIPINISTNALGLINPYSLELVLLASNILSILTRLKLPIPADILPCGIELLFEISLSSVALKLIILDPVYSTVTAVVNSTILTGVLDSDHLVTFNTTLLILSICAKVFDRDTKRFPVNVSV
jgi:hypothetical protein